MSAESRLPRLTGEEWLTIAAALVLTGLGLIGFRSSYGGTEFFVVGMVGAVLGVVVAVLTHRFKLGLLLSVLAAFVVYTVVGATIALPERATSGFLPSADTIRLGLEQVAVGWKELITIAPPVGRTADLMVLPMVAGFWSGFAAVSLGRHLRVIWLVIVPPAAVLALSIATGVDNPTAVVLQGTLFGAVAIGWMAWREHRTRPILGSSGAERARLAMAGVLLAAAFGGGHFASSSLPFASDDRDIWRRTVTPPFDPREHPSPLAGYRTYVKAAATPGEDDPVMFTVRGLPEGIPIRLATMDSYDGLVWQVAAGDPDNPSLDTSGSFAKVGASVPPEFDGQRADVTIVIGEYANVWVPDVGEVESLKFVGSEGGSERDRLLTEAFRYNRATDTGAMNLRLRAGDRYEMKVALPTLIDDLVGQVINPDRGRLGPNVPASEITRRLASPDLLGVDDTGARLEFVREDMTERGVYSDGDDVPNNIRSEAGHSLFRLTGFVDAYPDEQLVGNAEQYAATYALLFRELGQVPTRVVMGFRPFASSASQAVDVMATNVDAWVEVPIEDIGWVPIFPTPSRDKLARTGVRPRQPEPDYRTQNPEPPPLLDPEFDRPATAAGETVATKLDTPPEAAEPDPNAVLSATPMRALAGIGIGSILVALIVAATTLFLKRRRRRRRRALGTPNERIAAGWREVTDLAVDMGYPMPVSTTRREVAAVVGGSSVGLAERTDAAVWGVGEPTDAEVDQFWEDVEAHLDDERRSSSAIGRLKTNVSTRSFQRRETQSRRRARQRGSGDEEAGPERDIRAGDETTITAHISCDEAIDSVLEIAERHDYLIVASGPTTFRLARSKRPHWAVVLAVLLFPLLGLGLVFLRIRRTDSAVVSIFEDRNGARARLIAPTDSSLLHDFRALDAEPFVVPGESPDEDAVEAAPVQIDDQELHRAEPADAVGSAAQLDSPDHGVFATAVAPPSSAISDPVTETRLPDSTYEAPDGATVMRPYTKQRRKYAPVVRLPDGSTLEVAAGVVVGRDPSPEPPYHLFGEWKFSDQSVSRTHAALVADGSSLRITDLGSSNGTVIVRDGVEISCHPLQPQSAHAGDEVQMGDLMLRLEQPEGGDGRP